MEEVKRLIEDADRLLASIPVAGESVFQMAKARQKLKAAYDSMAVDHEYTVKGVEADGG